MLTVLLLAIGAVTGAHAQEVVTSPGPSAVSVTVYRAPYRDADTPIDRDNPQGFALITETRTVAVPAGPATIRFEGVASGILAESAIVAGLPEGAREKNLDADLLSPRSLFDRALGRRVIIQRTDRATGRVREVQGTIRSSKDGGMVLATAEGVEAIQCAGLPEKIVYDAVPPGLSAKPTLSIAVDSPVARTVTLTLSYLAGGFDWQANYVATMRPDGTSADLIAWLTLASDDITSFEGAGTQVVAGKPNRVGYWSGGVRTGDGAKEYRCWQVGGTAPPPPPPPPPPPMAAPPPAPVAARAPMAEDIVVTGARMARQEELGDFKLYRVPQPVTVAAQSQKQVALLAKPAVPVRVVYVSDVVVTDTEVPQLTLRARNKVSDGLGVALPAGQVAVFQPTDGHDVLIGEASTDDKAIGEDVELTLGDALSVRTKIDTNPVALNVTAAALTVTNANPWPVAYEAKFMPTVRPKLTFEGRTFLRDGRTVWAVTVPANGSATLRYRVTRR
jgi:hypothetical protein